MGVTEIQKFCFISKMLISALASVLLFAIGYVTAHYDIFIRLFELFIDVPLIMQKTKLLWVLVMLTMMYCFCLFLPLHKVAEAERQASTGRGTNQISATEQLKRRGSF